MAQGTSVTLEFHASKKDIRKMTKSLQKVAMAIKPLGCDNSDYNALRYAADLMKEIADKM